MNEQIVTVANEILAELNHLIDENKFDKSVFFECGTSAYESYIARNLPECESSRDELVAEAEIRFEKLYQSTPIRNRPAVREISYAYGLLCAVIEAPVKDQDTGQFLRALVHISLAIGRAVPMLEVSSFISIFADDRERREKEEKRSAQKLSAEARREPYKLLEDWALEMVKTMRGTDTEISFTLAEQIPEHIDKYVKKTRGRKVKGCIRVITNPQRTIYNALLARYK